MKDIKVFICEDDLLFAELISEFLNKANEIEVIGFASDKAGLLKTLSENQIDVLLLDINLNGEDYDGIDIAFEVKRRSPAIKTIVLSSLDEEEIIAHAIGFGQAANYITKEHYQDLPDAIRSVYRNRAGIHHSSSNKLISQLLKSQQKNIRTKINPTQIEILKLLSKGFSRKELARTLHYSEQTINNEICKISKVLKGSFPYLQWLRLKRQNLNEIVELSRKLNIIP